MIPNCDDDGKRRRPSQEQVIEGLKRAELGPDRMNARGEPEWFNDHGGTALLDAYTQGWMDAQRLT